MENKKGYIYILTNPSFKEYVKIGFATDVKQRLAELKTVGYKNIKLDVIEA